MITIERSRTLKKHLIFTIRGEKGDGINDLFCSGCPLASTGCSYRIDSINGKIDANVDLDSFRVRLLKERGEETNCQNSDIYFKA